LDAYARKDKDDMKTYDIKDPKLAEEGKQRIEWASRDMPVLNIIRNDFAKHKPFKDIRIAGCLHITTETANLALTLRDGGADVRLCASNPLSTQDDVAAALVKEGIPVYAIRGEDNETYYKHLNAVLDSKPHLTADDGADLVATIHSTRTELLKGVIGGTEETTTGVIRLRALEKSGKLRYPIIAVNDAKTKHLFDNRYGTGQSTIDGITRATNILWAGKRVVVCGYGWCGRGIAMRARGMGANVIVTEVDPVRALEAAMDGYRVMPIESALLRADVAITATGDRDVIGEKAIKYLRDGAILANSGHFNVEINIGELEEQSSGKRRISEHIEEYTFQWHKLGGGMTKRRVYLLCEGRLINLSAAQGHPASVMDMSFANQALCLERIARSSEKKGSRLLPQVYPVPDDIDRKVAELKLRSMGITIDELTAEQREYLDSWSVGT
jgi:adenosylhomocysteinase